MSLIPQVFFTYKSGESSPISIVDILQGVVDNFPQSPTTLCSIMDRNGSDKGPVNHHYTKFYSSLFDSFRDREFDFFELGIGTRNPHLASNMCFGNFTPMGSQRAWREFFPKAQVYAADIDRDILINEDRIKTFWVNQLDRYAIREMWSKVGNVDVIVEDGNHTFESNYTFFDESFSHLRPGGIYVVEDSNTPTTERFKSIFPELLKKHPISQAYFVGVNIIPQQLLIFQKSSV